MIRDWTTRLASESHSLPNGRLHLATNRPGVQDVLDCSAVAYMLANVTPADASLLLDYEGCRCSDAVPEKVKHSIAAGGCAIRV